MASPENLKNAIFRELPGLTVLEGEPMSRHTCFSIGGPADLLALPESAEQLAALLSLLGGLGEPFFVIGNGSNLLVSDRGIRGIVVKTTGISDLSVTEDAVSACCGASLSRAAVLARDRGLAGLEFSYGIPGSVGGAVYMNAGAYGGQMGDVVESSEYLDARGRLRTLDAKGHRFSYRKSFFMEHPDCCHVRSVLRLKKGDRECIAARMRELMEKRASTQPLDMPSAGSVFKRPPGHFAGTLIEKAGLKGARVGGAQVSEKHAGFIVNCGNASCSDVLRLIEHVQETVFALFGVELEPEVRAVGEF